MDPIHSDDNRHSMLENLNVFDDEFAVEDFDIVADGFAPGRVQDDRRWSSRTDDDEPIRSVAAYMTDTPTAPTTPMPRSGPSRNSIRKSREAQREMMDNPFRSNEDDDTGAALARTHSVQSQSTITYAPGLNRQSVSSISSHAFARTQSPSQGASGPSHPYAMYPQDTTLARTASVSTAATARAPSQPLLAQQGPAHPYSMYPQNVADDADIAEDDDSTTHAQTHIPVGFPGRAPAFHRRQGPEGEEQDIIGVDGHSEQLPPYSEYPEDGTPKPVAVPVALPQITPQSSTQLNLPLMQQQTLQRPQSMSDAGARAPGGVFEEMESNDSLNSSTKSWREKTWKEKRKTKFCGIPFWWLLLSACVLAFIAIVLGGAIGGLLSTARRHHPQKNPDQRPSPSSFFDASPIPTSSTGTPPTTGTYALSLGAAQATQAACLANSTYSQAWGCNIPSPVDLAIDIGYAPGSSSGSEGACLISFSNSSSNISYGAQPPRTGFSPFIAVQDNDDPSRGPAFYFQAFYDKVVVVPESDLPQSASQKRDASYYINPGWQTRDQVAVGDKPWFCYWNGTFLEGFIYVNNYTGSAGTQSSSLQSSSVPSQAPSSQSSSYPYSGASYATTAPPSSSTYSSYSMQPPSSQPSTSTPPPSTSTFAAARRLVERHEEYGELTPLGYIAKIEERRIQDSPAPYCVQMQILNSGGANYAPNPDGSANPVIINLTENDPGYSAYVSAGLTKKRSDTVAGGCHCQWWSGAS